LLSLLDQTDDTFSGGIWHENRLCDARAVSFSVDQNWQRWIASLFEHDISFDVELSQRHGLEQGDRAVLKTEEEHETGLDAMQPHS
jgi:hypothetical protein